MKAGSRYKGMQNDQSVESTLLLRPRYDSAGLIPVIAQHHATGEVLMLAYMNEAALKLTIETGQAHYWSRSRQSLWRKGDTSGETQRVVEMQIDCDQDAILMKIEPLGKGAVCHTGRRSCFYRILEHQHLRMLPEP